MHSVPRYRTKFQSTLPSRGATSSTAARKRTASGFQSTLPSRGATPRVGEFFITGLISIHAPLAGSDRTAPEYIYMPNQFQSTLPSRGATPTFCRPGSGSRYFNPRSPRGERLGTASPQTASRRVHFNPRSPRGERPRPRHQRIYQDQISIHAPLAGSDR